MVSFGGSRSGIFLVSCLFLLLTGLASAAVAAVAGVSAAGIAAVAAAGTAAGTAAVAAAVAATTEEFLEQASVFAAATAATRCSKPRCALVSRVDCDSLLELVSAALHIADGGNDEGLGVGLGLALRDVDLDGFAMVELR